MTDRIEAPFTAAEAEALNAFQARGDFHPYTCPRGSGDREVKLRAVPGAGWICTDPHCDYTQNWAHAFMLGLGMERYAP